jgi:long-chain acyl-CoA synthetase
MSEAPTMTYADKPWLKSYKFGPYPLKKTLAPYPEVPLYQILYDTAEKFPNRPACLAFGKETSYRNLKDLVDRLATALAALGVKKGDMVATVIPNCLQFIIADMGILRAGATHIPCSILHKERDLEHEIGSPGAETVICIEDNLPRINAIKDKTKLKNIIVTSWEDYGTNPPELRDIPEVMQFRTLLDEHEPNPPDVAIDPKEDLAFLCFTGGSTGLPKGVMLTHFNRMANLCQGLPWMLTPLEPGIRGKTSILIPVPLFHAYGHWVVEFALYWGLRIILVPDPRDNDLLVKTIQEHRPFLVACVPTQYFRMAQSKVGRMQTMMMSCAAPLPKVIADAVKNEMGNPISESYGLTETGPLTHLNVSSFSKITGFMKEEKLSLGIPVPDTEVKIIDPDTGEEVPFGEAGIVYSRGPQVMKGYWPTPGSGLEDGWLRTNDIARMDEDGYFYIEDRTKDMINVSGFKVYSTELDEELFNHPDVAIAAVVGIPDPKTPGSERVKIYIKPKPGCEKKLTADEIIRYCREKFPAYAVPKDPGYVEFRDEFPLTVTEKLFKNALRQEEIKKMKERGEFQYDYEG